MSSELLSGGLSSGRVDATGEETINVDNVLEETPLGVNLLLVLDLGDDLVALGGGQGHELVEADVGLSAHGHGGYLHDCKC